MGSTTICATRLIRYHLATIITRSNNLRRRPTQSHTAINFTRLQPSKY